MIIHDFHSWVISTKIALYSIKGCNVVWYGITVVLLGLAAIAKEDLKRDS
jgi:hypothetical protein